MKQSNNEIIKNKLTQHEFDFSDVAWEKMDTLLETNRRAMYWKWAISLFLLIGISAVSAFFLLKKENTTDSISVKETIQPTLLPTPNLDNQSQQENHLTPNSPISMPFSAFNNPISYDKNAPFFTPLQEKLDQFNQHFSLEKTYVHTDRTLYKSGEAVWFTVYVRDALTLQPSSKSDIVYVEWLSPKGSVEKKLTLFLENGVGHGDIQLDTEAKGGQYKIKAYTNWQKNTDAFFEKDITIQKAVLPNLRMKLDFERKAYGAGDNVIANLELKNLENAPLAVQSFSYKIQLDGQVVFEKKAQTNVKGKADIQFQLPKSLNSNDGLLNVLVEYNGQIESISRSIPIVLNKIDLQFMAEGGTFLENTENTIAFKAINEFGKSADVSGIIYDQFGNRVTRFKSYHMGMGSVNIKAQRGKTYFAKITQPRGITQKYPLPKPEKQGIALHVHEQTNNDIIVSTVANRSQQLHATITANGKIYDTQSLPKSNSHYFKLSKKDIPAGIATISILDKNKRLQAERLIFVNPNKRLNISITTNKEKYQPREKVTASIKVTDHNGQPVKGSFSLAAIDDKLRTFADDKQANILAHLLLNTELKGKVEEPNFYFENADLHPKKDQLKALDLLMLTQGWRKVSWVEEVEKPLVEMEYRSEKKYWTGIILDRKKLPVKNAQISIYGESLGTQTDEKGFFKIKKSNSNQEASILIIDVKKNHFVKIHDDTDNLIIQIPNLENNIYYEQCNPCNQAIKGKIIDEKTGEGIIGATIFDEVSQQGVYADVNGEFTLNTNRENALLKVSYLGYSSKSIVLNLKRNQIIKIDIPIVEATIFTQEIVIQHYSVPLISQDYTTTGRAINNTGKNKSIFGGEKIDIRPQGSIDLTFGLEGAWLRPGHNKPNLSNNDNTQTSYAFEDNQVHFEYAGHEDEILQKVEAGNRTLPLRSQLSPIIINEYGDEVENISLRKNQVLKIVKPAQYETITERIMTKAPSTRVEVMPAEYETATESVLAKAESKKLITVPAEYETVTETVEISPATTKWVKRKADRNCLSADPNDCQVWALVEVPARYEQITKTVLTTPATTKEVTVPAEYQTVTKRVVKTPATTRTIEVPAEYKTVQKRVIKTPAVKKVVNVTKGYEMASQATINEYTRALNFKEGNYPVREFYAPKYKKPEGITIEERFDFRSTAFWQPIVKTNEQGEAQVSFYNSDDLTTFKIIAEGIGHNGQIGQGETTYYSQQPFGMLMKAPTTVLVGDEIHLPLTLMNNTNEILEGKLNIQTPLSFIASFENIEKITLQPNEKRTIHLAYQVKKAVDGMLYAQFEAENAKDAFLQDIKVLERGFPVKEVQSGKSLATTHQFLIQAPIDGTLKGQITIYPDISVDILESAKRMVRQPNGCFEQVSSSNYPNLLVMDYFKSMNYFNPQIENKIDKYLDIAYKKLTGYEVEGGGFDWFGKGPAHEALTAYGLMEFVDMSYLYPVEQVLIDRTAEWLLSRRDGKGSWLYNQNNLHSWKVGDQISNAYINWALCEAGYGEHILTEIEQSYREAIETQDPYLMALIANALVKLNDNRAINLVEQLLDLQDENGHWVGKTHSITYSKGKYLTIETTALATLAILSVDKWSKGSTNITQIQKAIDFLTQQKSIFGYGSTQSTVLAMKAIIEFSKIHQSKTIKDGIASIFINDKKVAEKYIYIKNTAPTIIEGLEEYLTIGNNSIKIELDGIEQPLAHDVLVEYATTSPISDQRSAVQLATQLNTQQTSVGNTVRLTSTIQNTKNEVILNPIAIVGIPSGLSLQPWQLKELQEKNAFDYYELMDGYIVFHFIHMKANEQKVIHLDLKADIPGKYEAPASSAYLYYNLDKKSWAEPMRLEIEK